MASGPRKGATHRRARVGGVGALEGRQGCLRGGMGVEKGVLSRESELWCAKAKAKADCTEVAAASRLDLAGRTRGKGEKSQTFFLLRAEEEMV